MQCTGPYTQLLQLFVSFHFWSLSRTHALAVMNRFTNEQMADMHLVYGEAQGNAREAVRIYTDRFPDRIVPDSRTFTAIHRRLRETGSLTVARPNAGRERIDPEQEQHILDYFNQHPTASCRSAAATLGAANHVIVWNVLHKNGLHPFRYQRVQGLTPVDYLPRVHFSRWLLDQLRQERNFSSCILFTDEAQFTREGIFNHQNQHEWSAENRHITREHGHQHRYSVNVWAGIVGDRLIGPHILPATLTGDIYAAFLQWTLPELLENVPLDIRRRLWIQQDGAPAHFSRAARQILDNHYPNRWIGRGGPVSWPPRSPDLTPLDFFLWGHMKSLVYETPVESEENLIARIAVAAGDISDNPRIVGQVHRSLEKRCRLCIAENGRHFEQLL